jgi:hypothetical protein
MAEIKQPQPAKLISGALTRFPEALREIETLLVKDFGPLDLISPVFSFTQTDYYQATMGTDIKRQFFAFHDLISPDQLSSIKVRTNQLESFIACLRPDVHRDRQARKCVYEGIQRPVNIDPGYVTAAKLILATTKDYTHRIYLGQGIYAEVTLHYAEGNYQAWPWTYPDYQTKEYLDFFRQVRQIYLNQIKSLS